MKFSGLCIGGPLAGVNAVGESSSRRLRAPTNMDDLLRPLGSPASAAIFEYRHHEVHLPGVSIGIWIPCDKSPEWAMQELVNAYTGAKQ